MSGFWQDTEQNVTGEADCGCLEPMPKGTTLLAIISGAKWGLGNPVSSFTDPDDPEHIELQWEAIAGEYAGRKVFQRLCVLSDKKGKKHRNILAAIDFNCGGNLFKNPETPTDESLAIALCNKAPMNIKLEVWEKEDGTPGGNWVCNVSSGNGGAGASAQQSASQQVMQETVEKHSEETPAQELERLRAAKSQVETPEQELARLRGAISTGAGAGNVRKEF